jgi:FMN-dependent NADH-azoreductase
MIAHALDVFAVIQAPVVRISSLSQSVTAKKFTLGQLRGVACYAVKFTNQQFAHVRDVFIYTPMLTVPVFHQLQLAVDAIFGMGQTFVFLESVLSICITSRNCPERRCLIVLS